MAQLNSLIVTGPSRLLGSIYTSGEITAPKFIGALQGNADSATKATKDESDNNIKATYASSLSISDHTITLKNKNGGSLGSVTVPDNNTTYTFTSGTNSFSVTPSGGTAQTVNVIPSIADNITGSGTNGYIAKFNGAGTITNGPQIGSGTSTYLRNDGSWATPTNTTYTLTQDSNDGHKITLTPSSGTATTITIPDNNNTYSTGIGLTTSGSTFKAKLKSETAATQDSATAVNTTGRQYPVVTDKSGYLSVNVPWLNTTYTADTISIGSSSGWSAGTKPSLSYTARSVGSASNWSAGTMFSASYSSGILTLTSGTAPSLTVSSVSCDDITDWSDGTLPTLTVTSKTVATGITAS